jgi:hypothetical protein
MFFVHIPKTAGNYVRTVLKKAGLALNEPSFGDRKEKHLMAKDNVYRFNPDITPAPFQTTTSKIIFILISIKNLTTPLPL